MNASNLPHRTASAQAADDFVLLCYSRNTPYDYDAHTPLSILALGTYLETKGVNVEYFDERVQTKQYFDALLARRPSVVGFSVIGGFQLSSASKLSKQVRESSPGTCIVWGGVFPTTMAELTLQESYVDAVVISEGEETLLEMYHALHNGTSLTEVPGLVTRDDAGEIVRTAKRSLPSVEELPFVYQGKALDMLRMYIERGSVREAVGYEGSRGCPFKCTFCYSPNFHDNTRTKSVEKVRSELQQLRALGVDDIDIYDDTLFGARKRMFPQYMGALRDFGFTWIGNLRINMLTADMLKDMETSGCKWIYFGIESHSDEVLRVLRKGITADDIDKGIALMRNSKIPAVYSLIYGLPLDDLPSDVDQVLDFAEWIHNRHPEAEIQIQSFVALPGTDLYPNAVKHGFRAPEKLLDWVDHDHFGVTNPWLDDPRLGPKIYVSSFLAYRYHRHLSHMPMKLVALPLHKLSLARLKTRRFGVFWEHVAYKGYTTATKLRTDLHYAMVDVRSRLASRRSR